MSFWFRNGHSGTLLWGSDWGYLDNSKHFIFWLCNIKQVLDILILTVKNSLKQYFFFFQKLSKNGSKKANVIQLLEKLFLPGVMKTGLAKIF